MSVVTVFETNAGKKMHHDHGRTIQVLVKVLASSDRLTRHLEMRRQTATHAYFLTSFRLALDTRSPNSHHKTLTSGDYLRLSNMASIVEVPFDEMDPMRLAPAHSMLDEVQDMFSDFEIKQPYDFPWAEKVEG